MLILVEQPWKKCCIVSLGGGLLPARVQKVQEGSTSSSKCDMAPLNFRRLNRNLKENSLMLFGKNVYPQLTKNLESLSPIRV